MEKSVTVLCNYPRRSIEFKLKKKNADKTQKTQSLVAMSFIAQNYSYGSKYLLISFEQEIMKKITEEIEKMYSEELKDK
jgi:hypothetical protein